MNTIPPEVVRAVEPLIRRYTKRGTRPTTDVLVIRTGGSSTPSVMLERVALGVYAGFIRPFNAVRALHAHDADITTALAFVSRARPANRIAVIYAPVGARPVPGELTVSFKECS